MADAPTPLRRFFCHLCAAEISLRLPDYACPRCGSGFIEELFDQRSTDGDSTSLASTSFQNRPTSQMHQRHPFTFAPGYRLFTLGIIDENFDQPQLPIDSNRETENTRDWEMASRHRDGGRHPWGRHITRRQAMRSDGVPTLEGIIQQLVNGIIAPTAMTSMRMGPWGMLHSSPVDYAWGANGLDAIITQLMNQFENSGPPPAERERIRRLPTVSITEEHVVAGLECPVCKEDFHVEESVRQLPCSHLFHNDCIVPWLERHDTCPVCRKSLSGENTAIDSPELSGVNLPSSSSSSPNPASNENATSNS
ncbi:E3 ubiquitin-protein ligase RNF126-like [Antennarius striatus]|uniref:E3 ubiquitin-protein ligase RNF126-like n=1 Tax=Antennarius striatus TaxID=241820 RepID=UPI0035ADF984